MSRTVRGNSFLDRRNSITYSAASPPVVPGAGNRDDNKAVSQMIADLKATLDGLGPMIRTINERFEVVTKTTDAKLAEVDLAIKELRARVDAGARIDRDAGALVHNGRVIPAPSRELCNFFVEATREDKSVVMQKNRELSTQVGADGGFLIPQDRIPEILELITIYGAARRNGFILPMKNNSRLWPTLLTGVSTYWINENAPFIESAPTFGMTTITAKKLAGLTHWSSELFEDADQDLGAILVDLFSRAIAQEEDKQFFIGTGAGADPFVGWLYDPGVNVVAMEAGKVLFSNLMAKHLLYMQHATPSSALPGAKYFLNRSVLAMLQLEQDTTGRYIWQEPSGTFPGTIFGYPYELVEVMPSTGMVGQAGKPFVAFGNPRFVYFGDRKRIEIATSDQFAFNKDQVYMRILERIGIKVALPGALTVLKAAAV